ncbi:uncharacterized protein LOC116246815 [Nymphaea colorata]|nr:uncharacterized protein LOC116246815 [Nymphaea colorata]
MEEKEEVEKKVKKRKKKEKRERLDEAGFPSGAEEASMKEETEGKIRKRKKKEKKGSLDEAESLSGDEDTSRKRGRLGRPEVDEVGVSVPLLTGSSSAAKSSEPFRPSSWKRLDLVLSLRSRDLPLQRKIEIALEFVKFSENEGSLGSESQSAWRRQCIGAPRVVAFLSDWVQSIMLPSNEKKSITGVSDSNGTVSETGAAKRDGGFNESSLDSRCWFLLLHCLKSEHLQSLNLSPNVMRSAAGTFKEAAASWESLHEESKRSNLRELLVLVSECLSLILGLHGRAYNFNLEVWVSTSVSAVELIHKVLLATAVSGEDGDACLNVASLVLEAFANYLAVHPNPKNAFTIFSEKILEPLLLLLPVVMKFVKGKGSQKDGIDGRWTDRMLKIAVEILSNGLFHSAHIDGFLNLRSQAHSTEDKKDELTPKKRKPTTETYSMMKSYHKHFFGKLERLRLDSRNSAFVGVGLVLNVFVSKVTKLEGTLKKSKSAKVVMQDRSRDSGSKEDHVESHVTDDRKKDGDFAGQKGEVTEQSAKLTRADESVRKSLFDMFAELMKPLLLSAEKCFETLSHEGSEDIESVFSNACYALESINNLLETLLKGKIYLRAEDTTEETHFNFLKKISNTVLMLASRLLQLWSIAFRSSSPAVAEHILSSRSSRGMDIMNSSSRIAPLAKQVFVALQFFLDIEYRVFQDEMIDLWLLLLSYLAFSLSLEVEEFQQIMVLAVLQLGHHLINVYSELRQVLKPILALCKSVRTNDMVDGRFLVDTSFGFPYYLTSGAFTKAVITLLCSWELKIAISDAIKSIPEGQASTLILDMKMDIEETLGWIRSGSAGVDIKGNCEINVPCAYNKLNTRAELSGRGLSELYANILDSLPVTAGSCISVGKSLKDLMKTIQHPLSIMVAVQSDSLKHFFLAVTGIQLSQSSATSFKSSVSWIILFFIRLYASCRSLYRQSFCLMPPDMARKASAAMGDLFTAFSGKELTERAEWMDAGYFSWIIRPSICLLDFIQSISSFFLEEDCSSLVYVLHAVCLERLNDLNRQISALKFLEEQHARLEDVKSPHIGHSEPHKVRKMRAKLNRLSKDEASGLTTFIMGYIYPCMENSLTVKNTLQSEVGGLLVSLEQESWGFNVGSLNHQLLPIALWWLVCQNLDIWCIHASKRQLKKFLSLLLRLSLPCVFQYFNNFGMSIRETPSGLNKITLHCISLELLNDTVLYEQPFLCRYLVSSFCNILKSTLPSVFSSSSINFKSLPEWSELIPVVETTQVSLKFDDHQNVVCEDKEFTFCCSLLNFSCWMPKVCLGSKNLRTLAAYILNIERLVFASILECQGDLCQFLELFVCCRRALRYLAVCSRNEDLQDVGFSFLHKIFGNSAALLWLLNSVSEIARVSYMLSRKERVPQAIEFLSPLVQETSNIVFSLTEVLSKGAVQSLICQGEKSVFDVHAERLNTLESDPPSFSRHLNSWKWLKLLAEDLTEQARAVHCTLKEIKIQFPITHVDPFTFHWTKLSSLLSGFLGFLWGLISSLESIDEMCRTDKSHSLRWRHGNLSELKQSIDEFENFVNFCLAIFLKDDISSHKGSLLESSNGSDVEIGFSCLSSLNRSLLRGLLKDGNIILACLVGQLFTSSAAILKIKNLLSSPMVLDQEEKCGQVRSTSTSLLIGASLFLLSELAEVDVQQHPSLIWLNGLLKYLEVLGSYFPFIEIVSSRDAYTKLIDMHVKVLARCIALQGGISHLGNSEAGALLEKGQLQASPCSQGHNLTEFKDRLRLSFLMYVKKPLESHLFAVIQVLERALVGFKDSCPTRYDIETGSLGGGSVAPIVAAGLECMDMVLESVSSRKRANILGRHMPNLVSAIFNIVMHLQSPLIFFRRTGPYEGCADPGLVVLNCIVLLTRLSGWHSHFTMDACHVVLALHLPKIIFHGFCLIKLSQTARSSLLFSTFQEVASVSFDSSSKHVSIMEKVLSVDLYIACCRLLCAVVKHRKRVVERCIGMLGDSIKVLLMCLESWDSGLLNKEDIPLWDIQDAVKCASFLRRIYEEMRQQKDILSRYACHFLSNYIWVYSGCSEQGTGFRREVDEALRPGVYALVDICSPSELQQLHVGLGEGPCRNTLSVLKHDYEVNFKYTGKV